MAVSERKKKLAAALTKSALDANISLQDDENDIQDLIRDYFMEEVIDSNAESDDSVDISEVSGTETDFESDDDGETPLIKLSIPITAEVDINDQIMLAPDPERLKIAAFDCKCHTRHVSGGSSTSDSKEESPEVKKKIGCITQFSADDILARRLNMAEFTEAEKDLILLGVLSSLPMNTSTLTATKPCRQKTRQHQRTTYTVDSKLVCRLAFKFIYGISQNKLTALMKHFLENGLTPRQKRSGGRKYNTNAISSEDTERVVQFIYNFSEDHGLVLPGRIPGFKRSDLRILPSAHTKASIWMHYDRVARAKGHRALGKSSFFKLWEQHLPYIVVGKPMTDLCWQCKQNNERIRRSVCLPENDRSEILQKQLAHLEHVEGERKFYKDLVEVSKAVTLAAGITELGPHCPNSWHSKAHYSFDFAQQVHIPHSPLQPGPIYFLVPRKCGIFGVCCEGLPQQINYLIDEGMSSSKGSNMVISLLHHFFENFGLGEIEVDLHCDNCSGQNKNKFMLWYLAWRVIKGLHTAISVHFMPAGHTKFAPDWCFGLLKRRFKHCEVNCLADLCYVVNSSTRKGINRAQLVGTEAGEEKVFIYDWQEYFSGYFKPLKGIKTIYHFRFSSDAPGTVFHRTRLEEAEQPFQLACNITTARQHFDGMPAHIRPPGLSAERQDYLRQHIRPFVKDTCKDLVCP